MLFRISLLFLIFLSACRVGNYIEQPPQLKFEEITGYYRMEPSSLFLSAEHNSSLRAEISLEHMPTTFKKIYTNPIHFYLVNTRTGGAFLTNYRDDPLDDKARKFPVYLDTKGGLYYTQETQPETLWLDDDCKTYVILSEEGSLYKFDTPLKNEVLKLDIIGKIELKTTLSIVMKELKKGSCETTLKDIERCYLDVSPYQNCDGSTDEDNEKNYHSVHAFFDPFIAAGVMKAEDIAAFKAMHFEAQYK